MAVLGIDQVEHGPRRGSSELKPDVLFFNFTNVDAARGNPLQGAADQLSLARFAASLAFDVASPGGCPIRVDPGAILFWGHSQGATEVSLALPFANRISAAVLSGNGASLGDALVAKTKPANIAAALPFMLGGDLELDNSMTLRGQSWHPALTLVSQWLDPADPLHFARAGARSPRQTDIHGMYSRSMVSVTTTLPTPLCASTPWRPASTRHRPMRVPVDRTTSESSPGPAPYKATSPRAP